MTQPSDLQAAAAIDKLRNARERILEQLGRVIVGPEPGDRRTA